MISRLVIHRLMCSLLMRVAFAVILWAARFDAPYSWKLIKVFSNEVASRAFADKNEVKASVLIAHNTDQ